MINTTLIKKIEAARQALNGSEGIPAQSERAHQFETENAGPIALVSPLPVKNTVTRKQSHYDELRRKAQWIIETGENRAGRVYNLAKDFLDLPVLVEDVDPYRFWSRGRALAIAWEGHRQAVRLNKANQKNIKDDPSKSSFEKDCREIEPLVAGLLEDFVMTYEDVATPESVAAPTTEEA